MRVLPFPNKCEACLLKPALGGVSNAPGRDFLVCGGCADRLETKSLRPLEWFRLAALHGWTSYLLHDDFYEDDGNAAAPKALVEDADRFPYPHPDTWTTSISLALDVAYTKWTLPDVLLGVFKAAPEATLDRIRKTLALRQNPTLRSRAYEIAALCLGRAAESWIREAWAASGHEAFDATTLFCLAHASSACLPQPEGLDKVVNFLSTIDAAQRHEFVTALSWFSDPRALDALEQLVAPPLTDAWGRAAAACGIDWPRICRWLDGGRPLSLIALDALHAYIRYDTALLRAVQPKLAEAPDTDTIRQRLEEYAKRDPVPRVKRIARNIWTNVHALNGDVRRTPE